MNKETLIFLGKDSGFGEKNNSAYFEDGKSLTIIDCGFTVFQELKKKFDFDNYQNINVIITHLHNDHAGSLSQLILYLWFTFNKKTNIYSKCKNIKEYLDITGTPSDAYTLKDDISKLTVNDIKSSGYVIDTLEASLWVLLKSKNYKESIIGAINLGNDTDTIGAITGSMSGIVYGYDEIPEKWLNKLAKRDYLEKLCNDFELILTGCEENI